MNGPILIPGGSGLLGRALAKRLANEGREVVVLSRARRLDATGLGLPSRCRVVAWDGSSSDGWGGLASGASAIVNLAGESIAAGRWTTLRKERIVASRQAACAAVTQAIGEARVPPPVLVQASAVGFYGDRGDELLDESASRGSGFLATTTETWEAASAGVARFGVRRALVRTGIVLARDGGAFPKMALPFRWGAGAVLGSGRQWMPWIHLEDVVSAICFLLESERASGVFNLASPNPVTQREFSLSLARTLRRPLFARAPGGLLRLALGEMAELVLAGQRVAPARLLEFGFRFRFAELEAALAELCGPPGGSDA